MLVWPWWWRIGSLPTTTRVTAHCSGSRQKRTSELFCSLRHRRVTIEMKIWISLLPLLASKSWCHEYYSGHCPEFPPMKNFLWEKVCWLWNCSHNPPVCPWDLVCDEEDRDELLLSHLQVHQGSKWIQAKFQPTLWLFILTISTTMCEPIIVLINWQQLGQCGRQDNFSLETPLV